MMRLLGNLKQRARILKAETFALYLAARHPHTPWYAKLFVAAIVAYAFSPIDLIPDFVPVLGYLDDLVLLPLGIALAIKMIPASVLCECRAKAQDVLNQGRPVRTVEVRLLLITMQRHMGGVDVEDQFLRWFGMAGNELVEQHAMQRGRVGRGSRRVQAAKCRPGCQFRIAPERRLLDRYGRTVAIVRCAGVEVNRVQVERGMAWVYPKYNRDKSLPGVQEQARQARRGLWVDSDPVPPWEFRRAARQ
jgi:uncharacterized membrane protein YkvA (DUF1232 family)